MIDQNTLPLLLTLALCVVLIGVVLSVLILRAVIKSAVGAALREHAIEMRHHAPAAPYIGNDQQR